MRLFPIVVKGALGIIANGETDLNAGTLRGNSFAAKMALASGENLLYLIEILLYMLIHGLGLIMYCLDWEHYRHDRLHFIEFKGKTLLVSYSAHRFMTILPLVGFAMQVFASGLSFLLHWSGCSYWIIGVAFWFALCVPSTVVVCLVDWHSSLEDVTGISDIGPLLQKHRRRWELSEPWRYLAKAEGENEGSELIDSTGSQLQNGSSSGKEPSFHMSQRPRSRLFASAKGLYAWARDYYLTSVQERNATDVLELKSLSSSQV